MGAYPGRLLDRWSAAAQPYDMRALFVLLAVLAFVVGCSPEPAPTVINVYVYPEAATLDAAPDLVVDAQPDVGPDSDAVALDVAPDVAHDTTHDAVPDAAPDGSPEAEPDGGEDASVEPDAAPDAGDDAVPDVIEEPAEEGWDVPDIEIKGCWMSTTAHSFDGNYYCAGCLQLACAIECVACQNQKDCLACQDCVNGQQNGSYYQCSILGDPSLSGFPLFAKNSCETASALFKTCASYYCPECLTPP